MTLNRVQELGLQGNSTRCCNTYAHVVAATSVGGGVQNGSLVSPVSFSQTAPGIQNGYWSIGKITLPLEKYMTRYTDSFTSISTYPSIFCNAETVGYMHESLSDMLFKVCRDKTNVAYVLSFDISKRGVFPCDSEERVGPEEPLIPGLPDDLALKCLAKISHGYHGLLQAVCKRWHHLLQCPDYGRAQAQEGRCGDWLFVMTEEPKEGCWRAYDPDAAKWHSLSPMPGVSALHRHYGFACVGVAKKLLVLGGYYTAFDPPMQPIKFFATSDVTQFDPFTKQWSKVASMRVPRCNFACAVIGGRVYVAGGCSSSRRTPLSDAEVYDPEEDRWEMIAPLPNGREDCVGVALSNLFYIIAGVVENHADQRTVEIYDPLRGTWYSLHDLWLFSRQMPCPVTSMHGHMYALDDWDANTIKMYDPQVAAWVSVGPVPGVEVPGQIRKPKGFNFGLIGLRNELYVLGGKVLRWQPANGHWKKFDILRLNTVIACNPSIKDDNVPWRRVKSMGDSRGAVLGCAVLEEESRKDSSKPSSSICQ